eukprot:230548-Rhodomonas_salina.2
MVPPFSTDATLHYQDDDTVAEFLYLPHQLSGRDAHAFPCQVSVPISTLTDRQTDRQTQPQTDRHKHAVHPLHDARAEGVDCVLPALARRTVPDSRPGLLDPRP